jgi:preprotein translocase subunit SecE
VPRVGIGERISIARFFGEVISELRKVNWPTRQETTRLTILVLAIAVSMGIFLGAIDYLFSLLFERIAS